MSSEDDLQLEVLDPRYQRQQLAVEMERNFEQDDDVVEDDDSGSRTTYHTAIGGSVHEVVHEVVISG